jgi:ferredoxin
MRVDWDESRCALSGLCTELDDEQRHAVQDAAESCPTQAITVAD